MSRHLARLAAVLVLALAACGHAREAVGGAAAGPSHGTATVAIDDFRFGPDTVRVPVGGTVTWTNEDATAHTVTAGSAEAPATDRFDHDVAARGDTVSVTFDDPGTRPYFCAIHPFMTGTVEVTGP
jgi:plastocyanin